MGLRREKELESIIASINCTRLGEERKEGERERERGERERKLLNTYF